MAKLPISKSPDVMGGTPVFQGTRVPVQTLLDYIDAGESIDDFLEGFPSVTREQAEEVLNRFRAKPRSSKPRLHRPGDDEWLAIQEGLAQAERGEFVSTEEIEALLKPRRT